MLRDILDLWRSRSAALGEPAMRQAGAIPYTTVEGQVVFLLVTSRRTGRWIFPKGAPIDGLEPWEVAAREALEEAGVEGSVETRSIGSYRTLKTSGIRRIPTRVDLYPLRVEVQHETWAEMGQRHRHWVNLPDARRLLSDPRLAELAKLLSARVLNHPANAAMTR